MATLRGEDLRLAFEALQMHPECTVEQVRDYIGKKVLDARRGWLARLIALPFRSTIKREMERRVAGGIVKRRTEVGRVVFSNCAAEWRNDYYSLPEDCRALYARRPELALHYWRKGLPATPVS